MTGHFLTVNVAEVRNICSLFAGIRCSRFFMRAEAEITLKCSGIFPQVSGKVVAWGFRWTGGGNRKGQNC